VSRAEVLLQGISTNQADFVCTAG